MFLALAAIATYLRDVPHFQTWAVRDGMVTEPRQDLPAVDVRYRGALVGDARGAPSVNLSPVLEVTLLVPRGADAAQDLDAAFCAAIAALHGHKVQGASATADHWTALTLDQVGVFDPLDGQAGCQLIFKHSKRFATATCSSNC